MPIIIEDRQKKIRLDRRGVRRIMTRIMKYLNCHDKIINLIFVSNKEMTEINRRYLKRNYPTNVLAFSLATGEFGDINPDILGDIVISVDRAYSDACQSGIEFNDELAFLIIHGTLHLLNYDHGNARSKRTQQMKKKEKELFYMLKGYEID